MSAVISPPSDPPSLSRTSWAFILLLLFCSIYEIHSCSSWNDSLLINTRLNNHHNGWGTKLRLFALNYNQSVEAQKMTFGPALLNSRLAKLKPCISYPYCLPLQLQYCDHELIWYHWDHCYCSVSALSSLIPALLGSLGYKFSHLAASAWGGAYRCDLVQSAVN